MIGDDPNVYTVPELRCILKSLEDRFQMMVRLQYRHPAEVEAYRAAQLRIQTIIEKTRVQLKAAQTKE